MRWVWLALLGLVGGALAGAAWMALRNGVTAVQSLALGAGFGAVIGLCAGTMGTITAFALLSGWGWPRWLGALVAGVVAAGVIWIPGLYMALGGGITPSWVDYAACALIFVGVCGFTARRPRGERRGGKHDVPDAGGLLPQQAS